MMVDGWGTLFPEELFYDASFDCHCVLGFMDGNWRGGGRSAGAAEAVTGQGRGDSVACGTSWWRKLCEPRW